MELESNKYKIRLIIVAVILIISTVLGIVSEKEVKKEVENINNIVETIQGTTEEQYNEEVAKKKEAGTEVQSTFETKEDALATMQQLQDYYGSIYEGRSEGVVIIVFAVAISGSIISAMMYFIFTGWIINKIWPDIKKWMSILMRILVLIILLRIIFYLLVTIGIFGQLPFVIYTLYKYIKIKKSEDKDDVIKEK